MYLVNNIGFQVYNTSAGMLTSLCTNTVFLQADVTPVTSGVVLIFLRSSQALTMAG